MGKATCGAPRCLGRIFLPCGIGISAVHSLPKAARRVRLPYPALYSRPRRHGPVFSSQFMPPCEWGKLANCSVKSLINNNLAVCQPPCEVDKLAKSKSGDFIAL